MCVCVRRRLTCKTSPEQLKNARGRGPDVADNAEKQPKIPRCVEPVYAEISSDVRMPCPSDTDDIDKELNPEVLATSQFCPHERSHPMFCPLCRDIAKRSSKRPVVHDIGDDRRKPDVTVHDIADDSDEHDVDDLLSTHRTKRLKTLTDENIEARDVRTTRNANAGRHNRLRRSQQDRAWVDARLSASLPSNATPSQVMRARGRLQSIRQISNENTAIGIKPYIELGGMSNVDLTKLYEKLDRECG